MDESEKTEAEYTAEIEAEDLGFSLTAEVMERLRVHQEERDRKYGEDHPLGMQYDVKLRQPQPENVLCDVCGASCWDSERMNIESGVLYGFWGFDTDRDTDECACNLCEGCFGKVEQFIVSLGGGVRVRNGVLMAWRNVGNPRGMS